MALKDQPNLSWLFSSMLPMHSAALRRVPVYPADAGSQCTRYSGDTRDTQNPLPRHLEDTNWAQSSPASVKELFKLLTVIVRSDRYKTARAVAIGHTRRWQRT